MEAHKSLIKNIALFFLIGIIPSIGWASGYFSAFSWATLFLLLGGCFCILWLKERQSTQALKDILATRDDAWAICEGDQIIEHSPFFPSHSLQSLKDLVHPDVRPEIDSAIHSLLHKSIPFKIKVPTAKGNTIYNFEGEPLKEKNIFWLKNITESTYLERLNAENLQKKEELLHKLQITLDMVPLLIWHRDQDQVITYCNLAYSETVGALPQAVQREGIELIQPRAAKILARKAIHTNERQFVEDTAAAAEEGRHFRICEIPNALEQGTLGIAFDISELKEAQQEIQELKSAHAEVLDHLSTAIAIYDGSATLQYYNQAYVNLNSFDEEFLKAHPHLDEVLEELRSRRQLPEYADFPAYKRQCLQQLTEQLEPREELMHLPDERTLRNFSAPHPKGGLLFMYEDVTNYLSLERNNKTLLSSYQTTLNNLFEGVIIIGSNNRLEFFNSHFLSLWNLTEGDIGINLHLNLIVEKLKNFLDYKDDWETYKSQFIENITDRVPKTERLYRKDGIILDFGYTPLPNGNHLVSYTDITDTYRVQQTLKERSNTFEEVDRLKAGFIESVSYKLTSPLNTIISCTEILKNKYFGEINEKQNNYVESVLEASKSLLSFVNNSLDLASAQSGQIALHPRSVKIPELLENIVKIISQSAEKNNQNIVVTCEKEVNSWAVDEKRLAQILLNLLDNAIKFTPCDGTITIEAKIGQEELLLSISDTGIGIAADEQKRLLDTVKRGKGNSGIGLALAKNLVELHGGRMNLFSEANRGTTINCYLPRIPLHNQIEEQSPCLISCGM